MNNMSPELGKGQFESKWLVECSWRYRKHRAVTPSMIMPAPTGTFTEFLKRLVEEYPFIREGTGWADRDGNDQRNGQGLRTSADLKMET